MFTENEVPEALIGVLYEQVHETEKLEIDDQFIYGDIFAVIKGEIGIPTYLETLNTEAILDMDTLYSYPELFKDITAININNPLNKNEFDDLISGFKNILTNNEIAVTDGNNIFGASETGLTQFIYDAFYAFIGIIILLTMVLFTALNNLIRNERKLHSLYKLLGYRRSRILKLKYINKVKIIIYSILLSIIIQYCLSLLIPTVFLTPEILSLLIYILINIFIAILVLILMIYNIYFRKIREDL